MRGRQQTGDRARVERFERVFTKHGRSVFAYAARRVPDRADDVVAETFAVVWRRFDELPADVEPWLYGVARRVVAGQWLGRVDGIRDEELPALEGDGSGVGPVTP